MSPKMTEVAENENVYATSQHGPENPFPAKSLKNVAVLANKREQTQLLETDAVIVFLRQAIKMDVYNTIA